MLLLILIFTFLSRLLLLDKFPIGITHDELNYVIAAKSLYWTKNFAPGTAPAVFSTDMTNFSVTIAEVPASILAFFIGPLDTSLFTSRIIGAILNSSIVLAMYFLVKRLINSKLIALLTSLVLAINPWSFLMGRTIFETNFFVAFFLWGSVILLGQKGFKVLRALPFFILGFFSYTGGQIAFYLFINIILLYRYFTLPRQQITPYAIFFVTMTIILAGYVYVVLNNQSYSSRGGEIYTPQAVAQEVDKERQVAVQNSVNPIFINKITLYLSGFLDKYLNAYSVNNLFLRGELRAAFSYQKHGTFYFLDFLFIVIGVSFLFSKYRKVWVLVLSIIAAGAVTSGISFIEYSYSQRSGLIFPFITILIGAGLGYILTIFKKNKFRFFIGGAIFITYGFLFLNLLHLYFYRFPVYASDGWFFQDRILSRYIALTNQEHQNTKVVVSTFEPKIIFQEYLFFNNIYNGEEISVINQEMKSGDYSFNNVVFTDKCFDDNFDKNTVWIGDGLLGCERFSIKEDNLRITRFRDVYEIYLIKEDKICQGQQLNSYVSPFSFQDFNIEKQSKSEFCQNWITKL
ncbi:hypothetical protein HYV21_00810 [Candidatus Microgenomates bacterium]|nr:hypothetical protein [Candidatus Microgenomates bacterium]